MTIQRASISNRKPKLTAELFGKHNAAVGTVTTVRVVEVPDEEAEDGFRTSVVMEFREKGLAGFAFWPNRTSILTLIDRFGEDEEKWIGQKVPLVTKNSQRPNGTRVKTVWVADPDDWRDVMRSAKGVTLNGQAGRGAKKTTAKKAGRAKR